MPSRLPTPAIATASRPFSLIVMPHSPPIFQTQFSAPALMREALFRFGEQFRRSNTYGSERMYIRTEPYVLLRLNSSPNRNSASRINAGALNCV
jgi:hypothetical protein